MRKFLFLLIFIFSVSTASNVLATGTWQSCNGVGPIGSAASVCHDLVKNAGESYEFSHIENQDEVTAACYAKYKDSSGSPDLVGSACKIEGASIPGEGEGGTQGGNLASGSTGDSEENGTKSAEVARDATANQLKRKHATYVGGHKDGKVVSGCSGNPVGCAEDDVARQLGSDAQMTGAKGFRRNKDTGELEYKDIPVCTNCQSKYDKSQFPSDVKYDPDGAWSK